MVKTQDPESESLGNICVYMYISVHKADTKVPDLVEHNSSLGGAAFNTSLK